MRTFNYVKINIELKFYDKIIVIYSTGVMMIILKFDMKLFLYFDFIGSIIFTESLW